MKPYNLKSPWQEAFIANEASEEILVEAFLGFKEAWDSFGTSGEERRAGLQKAYIIDYPHLAGSKDVLDFAPVNGSYHDVHGIDINYKINIDTDRLLIYIDYNVDRDRL